MLNAESDVEMSITLKDCFGASITKTIVPEARDENWPADVPAGVSWDECIVPFYHALGSMFEYNIEVDDFIEAVKNRMEECR